MDRSERRFLARKIVKASPGLIDKIADEEKVSRGRAKVLAVRYVASGLHVQDIGSEESHVIQ